MIDQKEPTPTRERILETVDRLFYREGIRAVGVDIITLGQYLRPSADHIPIDRYVTPDEFRALYEFGMTLGFRHVESGPLVRSSYHAWEQVQAAGVWVSSARYFAVWRARSANGVQLDSMRPKPIFAATAIERSVAPARKIGGCGSCTGCGNSS